MGSATLHFPVLKQSEHIAVGIGDSSHQTTLTDVVRRLLDGGTSGGDFGQLRLDVRHVPIGDRRDHAPRSTAWHQPNVLTGGVEADVIGTVGLRLYAEQ